MKDIVRALEWNRDNIRYFGGDPKQVTIFGSSSGAMSVGLLTISNLTEGLFHRYVTGSGSALSPFLQQPNRVAVNRAKMIGHYFGCPTNRSMLMVNCLRRVNALQLVNATSLIRAGALVRYSEWTPTAEPDIEGAFITESPAKIFAAGKIRDLPGLISEVRDEGFFFTAGLYNDSDMFEYILDNVDYLLPHMMGYANAIDNVTAYTSALKSYYLNDLTGNRSSFLANLTQMVGDVVLAYPGYSEIQQRVALSKNPTYYCSFEYRSSFYSSSYDYTGGSTSNFGVAQSDELIYLFLDLDRLYKLPWYRYGEADLKIVDTMVELLTSFATKGTPHTADPNGTSIWEPYSTKKNYLQIGNGSDLELDIKYALNQQRMDFLDKLTAATRWK